MKILLSLLFLSAVVVAGCANKERFNSNSMRLNTAETITTHEIKTIVAELVERIQTDEGFKESYDLLVANKNQKPSLQIDSISNFSNRRSFQELGLVREYLLKTFQETGLFEIIADTNPRELASKISRDSKINDMDIASQQAFDSRQPADYLLGGTYRCYRNGDMYSHVLSLQLIDVKKSLVVWSDIAEITKE